MVSPAEKGAWKLTVSELKSALRQRWPAAQVQEIDDAEDPYALTWKMPDHVPIWEGVFLRKGNAIALDGPLEGSAEVAAWFRTLAPPEVRLSFYDEGYHRDVEITPGLTAAEVARRYEQGDDNA